VIIMLGLNDLVWFASRDPSLIAADMKTTIARARAARPNVRLLLVGVQPTKSQQDDTTLAARAASYNQKLAALAVSESTAASPIAYAAPPAGYQPNYEASPRGRPSGSTTWVTC
jgi:lysophospholipase L1-like esterase